MTLADRQDNMSWREQLDLNGDETFITYSEIKTPKSL